MLPKEWQEAYVRYCKNYSDFDNLAAREILFRSYDFILGGKTQ